MYSFEEHVHVGVRIAVGVLVGVVARVAVGEGVSVAVGDPVDDGEGVAVAGTVGVAGGSGPQLLSSRGRNTELSPNTETEYAMPSDVTTIVPF